jgi:hypothetical protein
MAVKTEQGGALEVEEKNQTTPTKKTERSKKISNILYKFKHFFIVYSFMMATAKNSTTTATASLEPPSARPSRLPYARTVQNFLLLWLDEEIDEDKNDDCRNNISKLRQVVNTVNTFTNADECIGFIADIKEKTIFIIVSGTFSATIVPILQGMLHVSCVYIFCKNMFQYKQWALRWSKVKGVFTDITPICKAVKEATQLCDQNMPSISFVKSSDKASNQNLDQLDQSFMYTQILKEILLTIDFEQKHIDEFLITGDKKVFGQHVKS